MKKQRPPLADRLKKGLEEALLHARGELELRTTVIEIPEPPPAYAPRDVVKLRQELHMSQSILAALLNVSVKTVQSWEQGERKPSQAAARLLQVIEQPDLFPTFLARQRERGPRSHPAHRPGA